MGSGKQQMLLNARPGGLVPLKLNVVKRYLDKDKSLMVKPILQGNSNQLLTSRLRLVKWINEVALDRIRLKHVMAYLAINYFDRVIVCGLDTVDSYDLLSVSCLLIAMKFEEIIKFDLDMYRQIKGVDRFSKMEILEAKSKVLDIIQWMGRVVTPFDYISFFIDEFGGSGADDQMVVFNASCDIIRRTTKDVSFLEFRPSVGAASAVATALDIEEAEVPKSIEQEMDKGALSKCCNAMRGMLPEKSPKEDASSPKRLRHS